MKVIFILGAFKNIQGLLWKIQGLFKNMMLFQGLFKARVNHTLGDEHLDKTDNQIWSLSSFTPLI